MQNLQGLQNQFQGLNQLQGLQNQHQQVTQPRLPVVQQGGSARLKVRVITWNLGDNEKNQQDWNQEVLKSWDLITNRDYDVLCIAVQEDWNNSSRYGKFGEAIYNVLRDGYVMFTHAVNGPPGATNHPFSVKAFLYVKKGTSQQYLFDSEDVCLQRTLFCTKSAAGLSLEFRGFQLIFISAHLPIDTKTNDLGYDKRLDAMYETFIDVYDKLVDTKANQRVAIIAGDLNFRDNTPISPNGTPVKDQLIYAMESHPREFRAFKEVDLAKFPPTCKLRSCTGPSCPACRNASSDKFDPSCYQYQVAGKGIGKRDGNREPSHCDRILFHGDNVTLRTTSYKSWGKADSISHSDHDLVYADLDVIG
jgi:endonuclease/exonuclease/phosphatase family metal-dependent hydrolase